jgi:2',3'-cyclic-nucleotide 2'-phosphodiesterase (5'-nucleotidase family)
MGGITWVVQAGAFYRSMGKTRLKVDNGAVTLEEYSLISLDESVPEYEEMKLVCDGIYAQLDAATSGLLMTTVGVATGLLTEEIKDCMTEGNLDTHVGNLCADAYAAATGADFAFQPGGSTAQPMYPGPIKVLDLFRTIGYGMNEENGMGFGLVTVDMTGEAILAGLEVTLMFAEANDEMLIHPSAVLQYSFNPQATALSKIHTIEVDGAIIDLDATYKVAINELLLMYFDYLGSMDPRVTYSNLQAIPSQLGDGPMTEVEALAGYVGALQTLAPDPLPGRVTSMITDAENPPSLPMSPELMQNYPNPFTGATHIAFTLPSAMYSTVAVYDVIGQKVDVLANRMFDAGTHHLAFQANDLPPGIYFCRLLAGKTQRTVRLLHTR